MRSAHPIWCNWERTYNLPDSYTAILYYLVLMSEERLYTVIDQNLLVFSLRDLTSPIATYKIGCSCISGIIIDNRLYLGGRGQHYALHVFEVTTSLIEPLTPLTQIETKDWPNKLLKVGHEILMGESWGYLQVLDINTCNLTNTHYFKEGGSIHDIVPIDDTQYLLAAFSGILKIT